MPLEGIDAKIHLVYYTPELEETRSGGQLAANVFIKLRKRFEHGRPMLEVANLGDAEELIKTKRFRLELASRPGSEASVETDWGGWLGRYYAQMAGRETVRITTERCPKSVESSNRGG